MRSSILAIAALVIAGCCADGVEYERGFTVDGDDPEQQAQVDSCLEVDARCEALCLELVGPAPSDTTRDIVDCYLDSRADGQYDVTVRYVDLEDCF